MRNCHRFKWPAKGKAAPGWVKPILSKRRLYVDLYALSRCQFPEIGGSSQLYFCSRYGIRLYLEQQLLQKLKQFSIETSKDERTYLPTYLPTYVPTYLPTYVHTMSCMRNIKQKF